MRRAGRVMLRGPSPANPARDARMPICLRMSGARVGVMVNFGAWRLKDGMRRVVA